MASQHAWYDAEGNQIRRTSIANGAVTEYEFDYRNRLVKVTERASAGGAATKIVTFQYDAFDRRTGKQLDSDANGTIDRREAWVWDGQQVVLQLVDADGAGTVAWKLTSRYLYGDIVDMVLADEQLPGGGIGLTSVSYTSGTTLWPLADHLGSVRDLVDNNGRVREHVVYNTFGVRLSESDWDANGNPIASNNPAAVAHLFGYTGREWDSDIELQYNRARWYDPEQGRWKSQDPIGFTAGDVNLYRVVGNHVTGATDPSGLEEKQFPTWKRPPGTMADIVSELHKDDAAMRSIIEQRHQAIMRGKATGEAGQRVMADMGGFGVAIDGAEAISGRNVLNSECEQLTTWQRISRGAWAVVGMIPFLGRSDDLARAPRSGLRQLVHLTDDAGQFGIAKTGTINGSHGIFAVPAHVARESTALKVLRTGLTPGRTKNAVPIPDEALELFKRPVPVGPYSGWKFFGGVRCAPAGSLSTATGEMARSGSLIGPKVLIYGPDGVFYVGIATAGGLYIYGQTRGGE